MNIQCLLGSHAWDGCKCTRCGKKQDKGHDWSKDCVRCARCGLTRVENHDWRSNCEECSKCEGVRQDAHVWVDSTCIRQCSVCREDSYVGPHTWKNDSCTSCGRSRDLVARSVKSKIDLLALQNPPVFQHVSDRRTGRPRSESQRRCVAKLDRLRREWEDVSGDRAGATVGSQLIAGLVARLGKPSDAPAETNREPHPPALERNSQKEDTAAYLLSPGLIRYRGLTFATDGEYSPVCDEKKVVRGIWYRDRSNIKNPTRNRMVVAAASVNGLTVLDSDYETTIVGGIGGVEELQNPGGAILWFDSTREIFGK